MIIFKVFLQVPLSVFVAVDQTILNRLRLAEKGLLN